MWHSGLCDTSCVRERCTVCLCNTLLWVTLVHMRVCESPACILFTSTHFVHSLLWVCLSASPCSKCVTCVFVWESHICLCMQVLTFLFASPVFWCV